MTYEYFKWDSTLEGWHQILSLYSTWTIGVSATHYHSSPKSLRLLWTSGGSDAFSYYQHSGNAISVGYFTFWVYRTGGSVVMVLNSNITVNAGVANPPTPFTDWNAAIDMAGTGNKVYYRSSAGAWVDTGATAAANTWHRVDIRIDCTNDTYSAWLNGVKIVDEVAVANSFTDVQMTYVWASGTGGYYLDDVEIDGVGPLEVNEVSWWSEINEVDISNISELNEVS